MGTGVPPLRADVRTLEATSSRPYPLCFADVTRARSGPTTAPVGPGARADLPFETASWERRILALLVDYAACWGVMLLIYGGDWFGNGSLPSLYLNLLFIAASALLMALSGGSFGQLACRLRVVRVDGSGRPLSLLVALLRQVLICW